MLIGTKKELAESLEKATKIPASVLRPDKDVADFHIHGRMRRASSIRTTSVEDEAYCLLGLFGMAADLYINKSVLTHVNKPTRSHNTKSRSYFDVSAC